LILLNISDCLGIKNHAISAQLIVIGYTRSKVIIDILKEYRA